MSRKYEMNISQLQRYATGEALRRGCYQHLVYAGAPMTDGAWRAGVLSELALVAAEAGEAANEARKLPAGGLTAQFREELADIVIRTASLAGLLGVDLTTEIVEKMNKTRKTISTTGF